MSSHDPAPVVADAAVDIADALSPSRRTLAFVTVMLAFVLEIVDSTIVNTALPAIQQDLRAGDTVAQWVAAGYFLSFALLLVVGGRLGDLYGYRRLFVLGVAGFTLASVACGIAPDGVALVAARIAQGAAAAIMAPQVIALVQLLYSPAERVAKLAAFGVVGGLAAIGGPIGGGVLIEADVGGLGWRAIFLVNLPVGLAALAAGWWLLPRGRSAHPLRLDPVGTLLLAAAMLALLVPAIEGRALGWPVWCWVGLALSPVLLGAFWRHAVSREARVGSALIAPALFGAVTFRSGLAMTILFGTAANGFLLVLSMTLQRTLGYGPLGTALLHLPFGLGVMAGVGGVGPRALPRLGARLVAAGATVMAVALAGLAVAVAGLPSMALLAAVLGLAGAGMGCVIGPLGPITLARVDRAHAGVAGGVHSAAQQVGGAMGAAVIGSVFFAELERGTGTIAFAEAVGATVLLLAAVAALALALPRAIFDR